MTKREKFNDDWKYSEDVYKQLRPVIEKVMGWKFIKQEPGNFSAYDIVYLTKEGKEITVEHKCDRKSGRTNNAFFETGKPNGDLDKPSGLTITTAELWAQFLPAMDMVYIYRPLPLLAVIKLAQEQDRIKKGSTDFTFVDEIGDGNANGCHIHCGKFVSLIKKLGIVFDQFQFHYKKSA